MHSSLKVIVLCNNVYKRKPSAYSVCHRTYLSLSVLIAALQPFFECGDYITYNSNMVMAIFFFRFYECTRLKSRVRQSAIPERAPVFQFMLLICRRRETKVKHCLEWWRSDINDAV